MEALLKTKGQDVLVTLSEDTLSWTPQKKGILRRQGPTVYLPANEIVTVKQGDSKQPPKTPTAPSNLFTVFHVSRRSSQRWVLEAVTFTAQDAQVANSWVQGVQERIQQNGGHDRPRKLLIFINPYGGHGKAPRIYRKKISPLFQLAGIESNVIETARANQARDYLLEADLQEYDGVVCVGGDGMFSELLHGLVSRTQNDNGVCEDKEKAELTPCSLRIGIIPAGSTDCVCFATVGINDPVTSALHIIIGDTQPMDVCASYHEGLLKKYSVSLIGYGFFGDVLAGSEALRWMGPLRYDVSGLKMVLSNRSYRGTVEFLEANENNSSPRDNTRCRAGCLVCSESSERLKEERDTATHCCVTESWQKMTGSFAAVNITCMSSACPKSQDGLSPSAHLADGTADLILVRKCNTFQFLRHLSRLRNHKDQFALPYVDVHRISAMRFTPEHLEEEEATGEKKNLFSSICGGPPEISSWNCDGEILDCAQLSVRVHHQLIKLFARGIEGPSCMSSGICKH
ncbi:ceramide kinase-like [Discoglossus pictus]